MARENTWSIVMPLKINDNGSGYRSFREIGMRSFENFLDIKDLDYFYIFCPDEDIKEIEALVSISFIPYKVVSENVLFNNQLRASGWLKQQIIKLAAARYIESDIYLLLDSDIYLNQPFTRKNLYVDDTRYLQYFSEPWHEENTPDYSTNSNWWRSSCKILNVNESILYDRVDLMSVTPQIFVRKYVLDIIRLLEEKYQVHISWQQGLCDDGFTEYTLYWLYIITHSLENTYSNKAEIPLWIHDKTANVIDPSSVELAVECVNNSFSLRKSYFSVIQGYLNISPFDPLVKKANEYLEISDSFSLKKNERTYRAVFLISSMLKPNRYQSFSVQERFNQTIETVRSAKRAIPNSFCILIEGSILTKEEESAFRNEFDELLLFGNDNYIQNFVNDTRNIGHGELALLTEGVKYIENMMDNGCLNTKYIFKLGARYRLNDKFDFTEWNSEKYNFYLRFDTSICRPVYVTGLFSVPVSELREFKMFLYKAQEELSTNYPMVERVYYVLTPLEKVEMIDILGLEGELSFNRHFFSI